MGYVGFRLWAIFFNDFSKECWGVMEPINISQNTYTMQTCNIKNVTLRIKWLKDNNSKDFLGLLYDDLMATIQSFPSFLKERLLGGSESASLVPAPATALTSAPALSRPPPECLFLLLFFLNNIICLASFGGVPYVVAEILRYLHAYVSTRIPFIIE